MSDRIAAALERIAQALERVPLREVRIVLDESACLHSYFTIGGEAKCRHCGAPYVPLPDAGQAPPKVCIHNFKEGFGGQFCAYCGLSILAEQAK